MLYFDTYLLLVGGPVDSLWKWEAGLFVQIHGLWWQQKMISREQILIRIGNADLPNDIVKNQMITLHSKFQLWNIHSRFTYKLLIHSSSSYTISTVVIMNLKSVFTNHLQIFWKIKFEFWTLILSYFHCNIINCKHWRMTWKLDITGNVSDETHICGTNYNHFFAASNKR